MPLSGNDPHISHTFDQLLISIVYFFDAFDTSYAQLKVRFREHTLYRISKSCEPVHAEHKYVFYSSTQNDAPSCRYPDTKQLLIPLHVNGEGKIYHFVENLMIVVNFHDQTIKPDDRINSLKIPVTPLLDLFIYDISNF